MVFEQDNEEYGRILDQLENKLTVSKEKEKQLLSFLENLLWTLNYVQYKTLEVYTKLKE